MTNTQVELPQQFLDTVYNKLGYCDGILLDATELPQFTSRQDSETWLEKGEWLALAAKVKADKVFFVDNDPVIVFRQISESTPENLLKVFRQTWCMSRPQCLFIASPGELRVYSLNRPPVQNPEEWEQIEPLALISRVADVSQKLQAYRREQVESRQVFREESFGSLEERADKRLISDLKIVRRELLNISPMIDPKYVHALIGRSIFVRYLEDRGVLTPEYFRRVAENTSHPRWRSDWCTIVETPENDWASGFENRHYSRVLRSKDFTYALFDQLTEHFNGDMFPNDPDEQKVVTQGHLDRLRNFLLGNADDYQLKLFLWAYDFEIVPIELISSIYEEFYHYSSDKTSGTHYTPSVLVEYVLSQVLTRQRLETQPRILDFACGSAIFLVQAFRRIVRFQEGLMGRALTSSELRKILRDQIVGIEINQDAILVAAFSLYLALLHYQEPKSILAQIEQADGEKPLPHLIFDGDQLQNSSHYHVLYQGNAFGLLCSEKEWIEQSLEASKSFKGRAEYQRLYDSQAKLPFEPNSFDVIVGNPPWGYLKRGEGTSELQTAQEHTLRWCEVFGWSVGDKELSQAFIARALSLVKPDGECGLLVSAGVFLKRARKSQEFRQRLLRESMLQQVVNFIHVRHVFFSGAVSPFFFIQCTPGTPDSVHRVQYWSAKKTKNVEQVQSVVLTLPDLHQIRQSELAYNRILWKVYWWGNHRDAALINALQVEQSLGELAVEQNWPAPSRGFQRARTRAKNYQAGWLKHYKVLPTDLFRRYGSISAQELEPISQIVHRRGSQNIYSGWRLLVKRGVTQADGANGRIEARLENKDFAVLNSIHGISLDNAVDWQRQVLIGILWSSLARYYLFMTTSSWGPWHHEIHLEDGLLSLPIRFPEDPDLRIRIVNIVDELRNWNPVPFDLMHPDGPTVGQIKARQRSLERQLDDAIFDLYELSEPEQDLVLDLCETGLEFFYRGEQSKAIQQVSKLRDSQGTTADLPTDRNQQEGLQGYIYAFLKMWNRELATIGGEFRWHTIRPPNVPMLAVVFTTQQEGEKLPNVLSDSQEQAWKELLAQIAESSRYPVSDRMYIDNLMRVVTDTDIYIIKRDEMRLWTRGLAREDAEATLLQAMILQETNRE
jgi:hypothetical protein